MADIFISYSSKDRPIVKNISTLLQNRGWTVWWDGDIPIGTRFDSTIEQELGDAKVVLVLWTKNSVSSEWVKNEVSDAAQRGVLIPVLLEPVAIPLAFSRIETAQLVDWHGEENHPEWVILLSSIEKMISKGKSSSSEGKPGNDSKHSGDSSFAIRMQIAERKKRLKRLVYTSIAITGILGIAFLINYMINNSREKNITVRIYDWKKKPVTQGEVKIYLDEYVRTHSIDKSGQVLFTSIPANMVKKPLKIEVSSPGYTTRTFDTMLQNLQPLELVLPYATVVYIKGKVKTAAEVPITNVEINVDGTRYYAISITDGSYSLRLEEYSLGDEVSLTTSHPEYEDKTTEVKITAPEILNKDIFLHPVTR